MFVPCMVPRRGDGGVWNRIAFNLSALILVAPCSSVVAGSGGSGLEQITRIHACPLRRSYNKQAKCLLAGRMIPLCHHCSTINRQASITHFTYLGTYLPTYLHARLPKVPTAVNFTVAKGIPALPGSKLIFFFSFFFLIIRVLKVQPDRICTNAGHVK